MTDLNTGGSLGARAAHAGRGRVASFLRGFDLPVFLVTMALVAYGLVVVYSASLSSSDASLSRQAAGAALGMVLMCVTYRFDYRRLPGMVRALFVIDCLLMVLPVVPGISYQSHGISGWIRVPGTSLTLQTAELAKPVTIMLLAAIGSRYQGSVKSLKDYFRMCAVLAVPFLLILLQPDLGTGLVVLVSGAVVIVSAGPRRRWVLVTLAALVGAVALILLTDSVVDGIVGDDHSLIKTYQMNRLLVFLNPGADSSGSGYNLQQALIAVGSGGAWGKGIGNATQASMGFLPEAHTDFVFALLSEEFGFVGAAVLVCLFLALILLTLRVGNRCETVLGKLICAGIAAMWAFQAFENIGMCLSLMPITGIPLPFISYGSSSMVAQLMTMGLIQSVASHRTTAAGS